MTDMPTLDRLDELTLLIDHGEAVYLRYSPGPEADATQPSKDHESGLLMSGVSANPLRPPKWWTQPPEDWVARSVCQYLRELDEGARPWVLTGRVIDFGPDNEPLLTDVRPIAWLSDELLAGRRRQRLDCARPIDHDRTEQSPPSPLPPPPSSDPPHAARASL